MANTFPDLGPKTISNLIKDRLSNIIIKERTVPVRYEILSGALKEEDYPSIYIEFIDIERADHRQFSGTIDLKLNRLSDGTYSDTAQIKYPDAYFSIFNVHLYAEGVNDLMDLVVEVNRRIPSFGYEFEIENGQFRLAIQRPEPGTIADMEEDLFFHRIYTYRVESYLFDYDTLKVTPNLVNVNIEVGD